MAKVSEYLDLFLKIEPSIRTAIGKKEAFEIAEDIKGILPFIKLFMKDTE